MCEHVATNELARIPLVEFRTDCIQLSTVVTHDADRDEFDAASIFDEFAVVEIAGHANSLACLPSVAPTCHCLDMTFSIVARSSDGTQYGVAVASKFLAVGSAVPAAAANVGAVATQANANLSYRPDGLLLLAAGRSPAAAIRELTSADDDRHQRQLGVVGISGHGASFTGADCHAWAGGRTGEGYAIQGNILVDESVVAAMETAWLTSDPTAALARRLYAALLAGDAAGGDRRGRQSAALFVVSPGGGYGGGSDVLIDLRVDDHPAPCIELARLLELHELYFGATVESHPLEGDLAVEVQSLLERLGYPTLESWLGVENFEERAVAGGIDVLVLAKLREAGAL